MNLPKQYFLQYCLGIKKGKNMKNFVMLFPGQGILISDILKECQVEKVYIDKYLSIASEIVEKDLKKIISKNEKIEDMETSQVVLLAIGVGFYKYYESKMAINIKYMIGHSLGEYISLVCSNAIDFEDMVKILKKRGELIDSEFNKFPPSGMISVNGMDEEEILNGIKDFQTLEIACKNGKRQFVISGLKKELEKFETKIVKSQFTYLNVSMAMHNSLLKGVQDEFRKFLDRYQWRMPCCNVISNKTALPFASIEEIKDSLRDQLCKPVNWIECIKYVTSKNNSILIDAGIRHILYSMLEREGIHLYKLNKSWNLVKEYIGYPEIILNYASRIIACYPIKEEVFYNNNQMKECVKKLESIVLDNNKISQCIDLLKQMFCLKGYTENEALAFINDEIGSWKI